MSFVLILTRTLSHIYPRGKSEILFTVVLVSAQNFHIEINGIMMAMSLQSTCYVGLFFLMFALCLFRMYIIRCAFFIKTTY